MAGVWQHVRHEDEGAGKRAGSTSGTRRRACWSTSPAGNRAGSMSGTRRRGRWSNDPAWKRAGSASGTRRRERWLTSPAGKRSGSTLGEEEGALVYEPGGEEDWQHVGHEEEGS
jgi:hypothetical protein